MSATTPLQNIHPNYLHVKHRNAALNQHSPIVGNFSAAMA
jgi:hypothetical protein